MRKPHTGELEDLVRWFTRHMSQETRAKLMGEMPVHYKLLYPDVEDGIILNRVQRSFDAAREQSGLPVTHVNL